MEETLRLHLRLCAEAFERATGASAATIGKRALNDNTFFQRTAGGQNFTVRTYDRLLSWFDEHWPEGVEWPEGVPRPSAQERAA